jgi:RHS repeat-associated protein
MQIKYKYYILSILLSLWTAVGWGQNIQPTYTLTNNETGENVNYVARQSITLSPNFGYTATQEESFSAKIDPMLLFIPSVNYAKQDGTSTDAAHGGVVGSIPGQVSVSSGGAATYSFPIECPKGIMGMEPNISLNYNSQGGDGPFGVGWGLGGLSTIGKSIKSIFSDGAITGIEDNSEIFTLDGQRMVVKDVVAHDASYNIPITTDDELSTSLIETQQGSTYQLQNKDYSKIESFGMAGYLSDVGGGRWTIIYKGPRTFKVTSKDGYIREYAVSQDVYGEIGSHPLTWYLQKVIDTNGNYMTYTYVTDEGQTVLKSIDYTGNGTKEPFESIVFTYISKTANYTYIGGTKIANKVLLSNIQIKYNNTTLLKRYDLSYLTRGDKYYLQNVTLTGQDNLKLNATTFEWGDDNTVIAVNKLTVPTLPQTVNKEDRHWLSADVNGDGLSDAINIYPVTSVVNGVSQTKNYLQVFNATQTNGQVSFVMDANANYDVGDNFSYANLKSFNPSIQFADLYGTNQEKIIVPQLIQSGGNTISFKILGTGTVQQPLQTGNQIPIYTIGDINNDGKDEIIYIEKGKVSAGYYPGKICYNINGQAVWEDMQFTLPDSPTSIIISDLNADGLKDLMVLTYDSHQAFSNNGGLKQTDGIVHPSFTTVTVNNTSIKSKCNVVKTGDFNGDGLMDFIINQLNSAVWLLAINDGNWNFNNLYDITISTSSPNEISSYFDKQKDCIITDFNHDGKSDVILIDPTYNYSSTPVVFDGDVQTQHLYANTSSTWYRSTGSNFVSVKTNTIAIAQSSDPYTPNSYTSDFTITGDFDGDGREDLLTHGWDIFNGNDSSDKLYLHNAYNTNFVGNLLKSVTNGIGKTIQLSYQPLTYTTTSDNKTFYTKGSSSTYPVTDIQMPLYCVKNIVVPNGQGGLLTTDFAYAEARAQLTGVGYLGFKNQAISNTTLNKKIVSTTDLNLSSYLPEKVTQEVSTISNSPISKTENFIANTQTGNIYESLQNKTISTDYLTGLSQTTEYLTYDGYGNPTSIKTTQGGITTIQTISYVQRGSWCPNKPENISVNKVLANGDSNTRSVGYTYDTTTGNLLSETVDAGDINQRTIVYSQPNQFGQPTKVETTANGATRTASISITPSGRFIQSKTDVLGQTTTYNWGDTDESRGILYSQTDRLGTTSYTYDGLGQLTLTTYPNGMKSATAPRWADTGNAYNAKFYVYNETSGSAPQYTWYDALGREVAKETTGLNGNTVRAFTQYYSTGQLYRVSEPTFATAADKWATTYTEYDPYGRPKIVDTPMGQTTLAYDGTSTTITSPTGTKKTVLNSEGQVYTSTVNGKTVTYDYYASGLTKSATPAGGQALLMEYDLQGHRTKLTDPDAGIVDNTYNGFGELLTENQKVRNATDYVTTTNTYDGPTGLLQTVLRGTETTSYGYDGINRLSTIEITGKNKQTFTYGNYDRVTNVKEEIGTRVYNKQVEYDVFGRPKKEIFPSGYYTTNSYDAYGNMTEVKDYAGRSIWKAVSVNARGRLTKESKGGKETSFGYDDRGFTTSIQAVGVVDLAYVFNDQGNLFSRTDNRINQREQFAYDGLNRLTNWDVRQASTNSLLKPNSLTYDATTGNISSKDDLGLDASGQPFQMKYAEQKADGSYCGPHALTTIKGQPSADLVPTADLNVTYTDFKKIATLTEGSKSYTISYGVDQQRRKSVQTVNGVTTTHYYLGDYEEEVNSLGNVRKIHYLSGAIFIQNNGKDSLLYMYADNQGSLIALTDESGNVVQRYAYDPWGARRNPDDWKEKDNRASWLINRGYTGHEHLDAFGIINMNGRVYDPVTAMFYSPDPLIQAPENWVNYNRYGYCMNNPLIYSDPSGYNNQPVNEQYRYDPALSTRPDFPFTPSIANGDYLSNLRDAAWGGGGGPMGYYYNWGNGNYYNEHGVQVSYDEVKTNYILPNAWLYASGESANAVLNNITHGSQDTNRQLASIGASAKDIIGGLPSAMDLMITGSEMFVKSNNVGDFTYMTLNGSEAIFNTGVILKGFEIAAKGTFVLSIIVDASLAMSGDKQAQRYLLSNTIIGYIALTAGPTGIIIGITYLVLKESGAFEDRPFIDHKYIPNNYTPQDGIKDYRPMDSYKTIYINH